MDIQSLRNIKLNFILTTARTGSTLFSAMLNMHPHVLSTVEEPFAYNLYPKYRHVKNWTEQVIDMYCDDFFLFSAGYLEFQFSSKACLKEMLMTYKDDLTVDSAIRLTYLSFFPDKDKKAVSCIVDKQLTFHLFLKRLIRFYPEAKFVILCRDPRDIACLKDNMLKKSGRARHYAYYAFRWQITYGILEKYAQKFGSKKFLFIKYEDFVTNPGEELKKTCSFFNIDYDPVMLDYQEKMIGHAGNFNEVTRERFNKDHSGLTQKINTDKIGIWKKMLDSKNSDLIWSICGKLAGKIGYKQDEHFKPCKKDLKFYLEKKRALFKISFRKMYYLLLPFTLKRLIKRHKKVPASQIPL